MQRFSSELKYRQVELFNAAEVVRFSFIVQNPISYLNLEISHSDLILDEFMMCNGRTYFSHLSDMIHTEEKCQKVLAKSRSLLYTLHLDLPRDREVSLKKDTKSLEYTFDRACPNVGKISIAAEFYVEVVTRLVRYACNYTDQRSKVLKWLMKFDKLEFGSPDFNLLNHFVDCMHAESNDTEFVLQCFRKLNFIFWSRIYGKPEKVESLLFQLHHVDKKIELQWPKKFIDHCIVSCISVGVILKIQNAPVFSHSLCFRISNCIRFQLLEREEDGFFEIERALIQKHLRRRILLWYLLWIHVRRTLKPSAGFEAMRLVWESIPDIFLSHKEIATAFAALGPQKVESICNLYSEVVGEFDMRSLKHFCRISIRRRLGERNEPLPDGIRKTGLPQKLQAYLNLQKEESYIFNPGDE